MKYKKIVDKLIKKKTINKEQLYILYIKTYKNDNIKSFDNMIAYLKRNNVITELEKNMYTIVTKDVYKYPEKEEEKKIYNTLHKEYPKVNFIVWNTNIINDFTLHYVMKNYIIVEVEKMLIDVFISFLKEKMPKKYTVVTQDILNFNNNYYMDAEKIIVVKPLRVKSPLDSLNDKKTITIEKIMVDLYIDKLYLHYQGRELQTIYENIFEKYDINMKRLMNYANLRMQIGLYRKYLNNLNIPKIYKN
jgi:hypothetical protein